jgi:hypothetical protein
MAVGSIHSRSMREAGHNLYVVWPVLFAVLAWQLALGFLITWLERWSLGNGIYFTLPRVSPWLRRLGAASAPVPAPSHLGFFSARC